MNKSKDRLEFNYNWNKKLGCDYFTTIRLWNARKYFVGAKLEMYIKDIYECDIEVVFVKRIYINHINNWVAYIDTGYSADKTQSILRNMYKNKPVNWETQPLSYVLLKRIKKI